MIIPLFPRNWCKNCALLYFCAKCFVFFVNNFWRMKIVNWIEAKIYTTSQGVEPLCGRLYNLGIQGLQIEDAADFLEFIENEQQYWDYIDESLEGLKTCETCVTVYLTDDDNGRDLLGLVRDTVGALKSLDGEGLFGRLEIEISSTDEEDWANNWKQYYRPFELGERLLICPEWEEVPENSGKTVLKMNPGHLFGTGTHHSTQLCMMQLERAVKEGDRVLDLGCGSGILSILSLLLGAQDAVAVDIDPSAPQTVGENMEINSLDNARCKVYCANVVTDTDAHERIGGGYDIVVANIVADVIIAMSSFAYSAVREGGTFITSGIIGPRADEVAQALTDAGFRILERAEQNDWVCIRATK